MKKPAVVVIGILLLLIPLPIYLFAQQNTAAQQQPEGIVVREAIAGGSHYIVYAYDDTLYLKHTNQNTTTPLRKVTGQFDPILKTFSSNAVTDFAYLPGTSLIDPASLRLGISPSIPYTYDSTIENSSAYLETLRQDGWRTIGLYSTPKYIDTYLEKKATLARVIILKNSIKVFHDIQGRLPDPEQFVRE
ncbi:hypothetical protein [Cohnella cholangitidis]|uniref:Uncharacterized protein n=1 Tax=Cohnella cholangitidis TaxID=2598458 RepID=A0A7G5BU77_9BACL|nr:hypothetical protein [Cohnella cholangitidis]QMV40511.1 hypothetical protein FPL14_04285 [Cohnella cholangitidis]